MIKVLFSFLAMIISLPLWAQRDVKKEVLIYFGNGVGWETRLVNGIPTNVVEVKKESLKQALLELDILESDLIVAVPDFNLADTMQVLPDGKVIPRINLSKFYIYTVKAHQNLMEVILQLRQLPEVVMAGGNYAPTVADGGPDNGPLSPFSTPVSSKGLFTSQTLSFASKPLTPGNQEQYRDRPQKGQTGMLAPVQEKLPILNSVAVAEIKVSAYPNPAREKLRLEMRSPGEEGLAFARIELYEALSGKMVRSLAIKNALNRQVFTETGTIEVDVRELPRGLYHLQLIPASQQANKSQALRIILE